MRLATKTVMQIAKGAFIGFDWIDTSYISKRKSHFQQFDKDGDTGAEF